MKVSASRSILTMYQQQHDCHKIFPGFYIGSVSAVNRETLDTFHISHVISVINDYKPRWTKMYKYLVLNVMDMEEENIEQYFEETFKFIEKGREEGAVLVHCQAGISRSASICIAYCIRKLKITYEDAHGIVQDARSIIYPNEGFIKQLQAYEHKIRGTKPPSQAKPTGPLEIESIDSSDSSEDSLDQQQIKFENKFRYTCRRCSKELFLDSDIESHEQGEGQSSFNWNKRDHKPNNKQQQGQNSITEDQEEGEEEPEKIACTSYFLNVNNEFVLTQTANGENGGKIICDNPNCKEKIGSWCWSGDKCSCGTWITPFFQVPKTRVDEKPLKNEIVFVNKMKVQSEKVE
ncbi:putative protein tyrosine phosphatase [Tieghemostelium lacteum]|uniref:protein-tyrosine-phosphatase n=1 Tax=Tieghemostelium lacteum TaxID=361077 RepID=A0A151ZFT1_TIELA|nr:putative protein tyrosine phosphatase [Tieghemostelium lacteum]|eukprot:KYQ92826.1 putative protein tyrosine phosphatase [Tieghemostelium lacteum]